MVSRKEESKRKIRRITVRSLLNLKHYQFKVYIKYLAMKYGKIVIDVNEVYTSKTVNGTIINVGSKEVIEDKGMILDRDINGARNILIRFLTNSCKVNTLHT